MMARVHTVEERVLSATGNPDALLAFFRDRHDDDPLAYSLPLVAAALAAEHLDECV